MTDQEAPQQSSSPSGSSINPALIIAIIGFLAMGGTWWLAQSVGGTTNMVLFLLCQVFVVSILIWQACDPFADAAQWIGVQLRLPGSVRGATLDAVSSSLPELFTGIFFVVLAVGAANSAEEIAVAGSDGLGPTIATCAGSAIYNMILIPAICAIIISYTRKNRPTIDVSASVLLRDGLWFLGCEMMLILFLFQNSMSWWMGVVLVGMYLAYVVNLYRDAKQFQRALAVAHEQFGSKNNDVTTQQIQELFQEKNLSSTLSLATEVRNRLYAEAAGDVDPETGEDADDDTDDGAGLFFGMFEIPLTTLSAWTIILLSTFAAAVGCFWLVEITRTTADILNIPLFFVAVILAAAASSVPDTFISIGSARRGDDDGAVSNAFGSNIFDICICISVPLFIGCYLNGWQPILLTQNGEPMPGLTGIRILLCVLTIITLLIMWHNKQLTRNKAWVLCGLYVLFVLYTIVGSLGYTFDSIFA